jgi:hypothetical protein
MHSTLSSSFLLACLAALAAILCLGGVLAAQALEATPGPTTQNPVEPPPAPIPAEAIPEQFSRTAAVLRAVTSHTQPDPDIARLEQILPDVERDVQALLDATATSLRTHPSLSQLHDTQAPWVVATLQLRGWQAKLRARSTQLEDDLRDVTRRAQEWRLTADAATANQLPQTIIEHIGKTSVALTEATDRLCSMPCAIGC